MQIPIRSQAANVKHVLWAAAFLLEIFHSHAFSPTLPLSRGFDSPWKRNFELAGPSRSAKISLLSCKGSLQRKGEGHGSSRLHSAQKRIGRSSPTYKQAPTHNPQTALAMIEPRSALTLITVPYIPTPFQQRIAVALLFSLCIALPGAIPQNKNYRKKLAELQRQIPGSDWLQGARERVVERVTERHFALLAVLGASCLPLLFGLAIGFTSPCLGPICTDLSLSTVQASSFASILSIGAVSAAFLGMRQISQWGRQPVMVMCAASYAAGYALIMAASALGYGALIAGRFLTGVGAGLANVVTPMYIAEMSPPKLRGLFGTLYQLATCAGILIMYVVGAMVDWRVAAAGGALLAGGLTVATKLYMPETPAYLLERGREKEAGQVLQRLVPRRTKAEAADILTEMKKVQGGAGDAGAEGEGKKAGGGLLGELVGSVAMRRSMGMIVALMFFQQFTGINAVMYFSTQILEAAGYGVSASKAAMVLAAAQLAGTAYSGTQADARNRRSVLLASGAGMAVGMALITAYFAFQGGLLAGLPLLLGPETAVLGLLVYIVLFSVGWGPVPWLLVSELFPPHKRPLATGICTVLAWGGTFVITQGTTMLLAGAGPTVVFSGFLLATLASVVWAASPVFVETKGKSIAQVQADLAK